jgi:hypothetical protein
LGRIIVDVEFLDYKTEKWIVFARNITIEVEEVCNKAMNKAFEEQHPRLMKRVPTFTNSRGFKFRNYFECQPHHDSWKEKSE